LATAEMRSACGINWRHGFKLQGEADGFNVAVTINFLLCRMLQKIHRRLIC
jgi:hypothetical protein